MPPLPKSKATRSGSGTQPSGARAGRGSNRESSSTPPPSTPPRRGRVTKAESLEVKVARMYNMAGTMLSPLGRFYPAMGPLGQNLKNLSDEAAEAWIELAEQDGKVKEMLETMTGASLWGNVIGVHFAIFSAVIPGGEQVGAAMASGMSEEEMFASMFDNMSPAEQEAARNLAATMAGTPPGSPARDHSTGGPGDTVQAAPAPEYDPTATPSASAAPSGGAAIVTPEQLGVQVPGEQGIFPNDPSGPNGRA
jgi:hypothetical protein